MEKKQFEKAEMFILKLDAEDVICTSGGGQAPWIPVTVDDGLNENMGNDAGIQGEAN